MSFVSKIKEELTHHERAVVDAPETQKIRVSFERRILNMEKLFEEHVSDSAERQKALVLLRLFREAGEAALDVDEREVV